MFKRTNIDYITRDMVSNELSTFNDCNWEEPSESFKELCKQRAQQLRDSYDYIILYFSGGSDSTTVLNSFLDNNISIDEIVIVKYDLDSPCVNGKKAEEDLIKKNYKGRYNLVDISFDKISKYLKKDNCLSDGPNFSGQLHAFLRYNITYLEKFGFALPIFRKGKICHLYGEKDPDVIFMNNNYFARLSIKNMFVSSHDPLNVMFFTDISFPKLHIKQCHITAKFMLYCNATKNIKLCVRDFYSPLISPIKSKDDPNFVLNNLNIYSESTVLLANFLKADSKNKDLYINSVYKSQFDISRKINDLNIATFKYHLLKLRP